MKSIIMSSIPVTSVVSSLQAAASSYLLVDTLNMLSWFMIPAIFLYGLWGGSRAAVYGPPQFEETSGNLPDQLRRWDVWYRNTQSVLDVESSSILSIAATCTGLGFLGTTFGIICLLAKFGLSGTGSQFDISGLHTSFYTTAAGLISALSIERIVAWKNKRIKRKLLIRDFQFQIEASLLEVAGLQRKDQSEDERIYRLERMFHVLQQQIERMEFGSSRKHGFSFMRSDREQKVRVDESYEFSKPGE